MKYKHLIFDFDGVLVESNEIRFDGFSLLFSAYPTHQVDKLIQFAMANGGLSRYAKIRYFFEKIRNESISDEKVKAMSHEYSNLVKQRIIESKPVEGSLEFLSQYHNVFDFAIISGSDQEELIEICRIRGIHHYFTEILGAPLSKEENFNKLFLKTGWQREDALFVGDTTNDLDAARSCGVFFIGRNSGLVNWGHFSEISPLNNLSQLYLHVT